MRRMISWMRRKERLLSLETKSVRARWIAKGPRTLLRVPGIEQVHGRSACPTSQGPTNFARMPWWYAKSNHKLHQSSLRSLCAVLFGKTIARHRFMASMVRFSINAGSSRQYKNSVQYGAIFLASCSCRLRWELDKLVGFVECKADLLCNAGRWPTARACSLHVIATSSQHCRSS